MLDDSGSSSSSTVAITSTFSATDTDGISNRDEYLQGSNPRVDEIHGRDTPFLPPWASVLLAGALMRLSLRHQRNSKRS